MIHRNLSSNSCLLKGSLCQIPKDTRENTVSECSYLVLYTVDIRLTAPSLLMKHQHYHQFQGNLSVCFDSHKSSIISSVLSQKHEERRFFSEHTRALAESTELIRPGSGSVWVSGTTTRGSSTAHIQIIHDHDGSYSD